MASWRYLACLITCYLDFGFNSWDIVRTRIYWDKIHTITWSSGNCTQEYCTGRGLPGDYNSLLEKKKCNMCTHLWVMSHWMQEPLKLFNCNQLLIHCNTSLEIYVEVSSLRVWFSVAQKHWGPAAWLSQWVQDSTSASPSMHIYTRSLSHEALY